MRVFRELIISGPSALLDELLRHLDEQVRRASEAGNVGGWHRDQEAEGALRQSMPLRRDRPAICYARPEGGGLDAARLWIDWRSDSELHVSNVVPTTEHRLGHDRYNRIVEDFYRRFIVLAAEGTGVTAAIAEDEAGLNRWHEFLIRAHQEGTALNASMLERWLTEEAAWPAEAASEFAVEYDVGRQLLRDYDRAQAGSANDQLDEISVDTEQPEAHSRYGGGRPTSNRNSGGT